MHEALIAVLAAAGLLFCLFICYALYLIVVESERRTKNYCRLVEAYDKIIFTCEGNNSAQEVIKAIDNLIVVIKEIRGVNKNEK